MHAPTIWPASLLLLTLAAPVAASTAGGPEYRPLAGANQLKRGESLKPKAGNIDLPPVVIETRVHYHADGSARLECHQTHAQSTEAAADGRGEQP